MFVIIWRLITIILVALFMGLEFAHTLEPVNIIIEQANAKTIPTNWQQLRNQWEYAHATNFI
ncbi:MAG: hypothetical protein WBV73_04370, partial [Phormidium sp.]